MEEKRQKKNLAFINLERNLRKQKAKCINQVYLEIKRKWIEYSLERNIYRKRKEENDLTIVKRKIFKKKSRKEHIEIKKAKKFIRSKRI